MRRRPRIDLGQQPSGKEEFKLQRKRLRWDARNKDRPEENPFLTAIKPDKEHYGELDEQGDVLKARLDNLEYGNFPGYFNYRNKAAQEQVKGNETKTCDIKISSIPDTSESPNVDELQSSKKIKSIPSSQPLEAGLSDERLKCFKSDWFKDRDVLDIGCNRGHLTYAIARLFSPKSIVGIDIDLKMVNMANRDLHLHLEDGFLKQALEWRIQRATKLHLEDAKSIYTEDEDQFPLSNYIQQGPLTLSKDETDEQASSDSNQTRSSFPNNLVFVEHNYVLANDELVSKQKAYFNTIVCLSVTKWIHLNYRDDGLKRFFKRIYNHLNPNGLLILEAQPFDNYCRRKKLSDRLRANYYSIKFKPDEFDDYLLSDQIGFKQIVYDTVTEHECTGFKRPLKVFVK